MSRVDVLKKKSLLIIQRKRKKKPLPVNMMKMGKRPLTLKMWKVIEFLLSERKKFMKRMIRVPEL
ncbi:MAG: hypothetical protein BWY64_03921 [bacterium ADurb.Bin363]|nr:MAG: hypothetical protein BWY64_03921 [bacterium ADurb.Bin363]